MGSHVLALLACAYAELTVASSPTSIPLSVTNNCGHDAVLYIMDFNNVTSAAETFPVVGNGATIQLSLTGAGTATIIPKFGCENTRQNCTVGQSITPCWNGTCQPGLDSKAVFVNPSTVGLDPLLYYALVQDGFTAPFEISTSSPASCPTVKFSMETLDCPTDDDFLAKNYGIASNGLQYYAAKHPSSLVGCKSPCMASVNNDTLCCDPLQPNCYLGKTKYFQKVTSMSALAVIAGTPANAQQIQVCRNSSVTLTLTYCPDQSQYPPSSSP